MFFSFLRGGTGKVGGQILSLDFVFYGTDFRANETLLNANKDAIRMNQEIILLATKLIS